MKRSLRVSVERVFRGRVRQGLKLRVSVALLTILTAPAVSHATSHQGQSAPKTICYTCTKTIVSMSIAVLNLHQAVHASRQPQLAHSTQNPNNFNISQNELNVNASGIFPQKPDTGPEPIKTQISFALAIIAALLLFAAFIRERRLKNRLMQLVHLDYLTSIYNRRYLYQLGQRYLSRSQSNGDNFSLILIDVDYFKTINDNHGHAAGDKLLQEIAQICTSASRPGDVVGRMGGEEFLMLLPETNLREASSVAERIRHTLNQITLPNNSHLTNIKQLSASFGVTSSEQQVEHFEDLVKTADQAMYQAKAEGRNCVRTQMMSDANNKL